MTVSTYFRVFAEVVSEIIILLVGRPTVTLYDAWGQNFTSAPSHPIDPKKFNDQPKR